MDHVTQDPDVLRQHLEVGDAALEARWQQLQAWLARRFGQEPGMEAVLFLIGIQSRGCGFEPELGKEAKQDLIMEGAYCAFETLGLYQRVGAEADGRWVWERAVPRAPALPVEAQEKLLRVAVLQYFDGILAA